MAAIGTSLAIEFQDQLERRATEFANALPSSVKPENFLRAAKTAIALNPKLLEADRRSLINELMRCAQDGLIPDGRQAVLVIYKSARGPVVRYQQMVAGIRKLVQQSGEITRFEQTVVYSCDKFSFQLGDQPHIAHEPALDRTDAKPILVYSIAQFSDGTLSREVMTAVEIEKVRESSRAKDDGPWVDWWDEMARKTVAKRHAKVLPMSSDAAEALANDDDNFRPQPLPSWPTERRSPLTDQLETQDSGPTHQPEGSGGRHQRVTLKPGASTEGWEPLPDDDGSISTGPPAEDVKQKADFFIGFNDAEAGRTACLNSDIKKDKTRLADWQRGFDSYKRK